MGANVWQLWFQDFHEIPPSTRSDALSRRPSLILFSLGLAYCTMKSLVVVLVLAVAAARAAFSQTPTPDASHIREALVGSWVLVSRRDFTHDGKAQIESSLGETPRGLLFYGADGHMAVQLMRLDAPRNSTSLSTSPVHQKNNTDTSSGYDAYFGTYTVDPVAQTVTHHVEGALSPGDVGKSLTRRFRLQGAELTLSFDTSASDGTPVTRTVVWRRTQ